MKTEKTKKNNELRVLIRRNEVARLFRRGHRHQAQLAAKLTATGEFGEVSQSMVSRDLAAIENQVRDQAFTETANMRDHLLAEIQEVKREAWAAWEDSKAEKESIKDKSPTWRKTSVLGNTEVDHHALEDAGLEDGYVLSDDLEVTITSRDPNAKFLDTVLDCIKQERELLGVDKPNQASDDDGSLSLELSFQGMSDTELAAMEVMVKRGDKEALVQFISAKVKR